MGIVYEILNNKAIIIPVLAWLAAQSFKIATQIYKEKRFDFTWIFASGGMPSSHSSFSVSLAIVLGKNYGWDSGLFAMAVAFAFIVMYDAAGVRRAAGKQAKVINKLIHSHFDWIKLEEKLKELVGHTPFEVFMGALLGIVLGFWLG